MKKISIQEAEQKMWELLDKEHLEDRLYELARELTNQYIEKIEKEYTIVDVDGVPCNSELSEDGEMWYDDVREELVIDIFERVTNFVEGE